MAKYTFNPTLTFKVDDIVINTTTVAVDLTAEASLYFNETVADSVTNEAHALAIVAADLQAFYLVSDAAVTIETNDSGAPDDTFTLAANTPLAWYSTQFAGANPVTADIDSIFISNVSGGDAVIKLYALTSSD